MARTYQPRSSIAGAKEAFWHHPIKQRPEHRSTDSHYGNTGFSEGPIRGSSTGVGEVLVVDVVDCSNAYDSNNDDTGRRFLVITKVDTQCENHSLHDSQGKYKAQGYPVRGR